MCTACELAAGCTSPCIPMRPWEETQERKSRALLVTGEAPGYHEDIENSNFVGKSGQLLDGFIRASGLGELADVWLANAARCRPPQNAPPPPPQCPAASGLRWPP